MAKGQGVEQQGWLEATDGARVALHRWPGTTTGKPALLWGHANGFAARCYLPLLAELARDFDVWAWDARGQGFSGLPASSETGLDAIAGDAAMVLRHVQGETGQVPHVASHSFSGVALLWAGLTLGLAWRSATFFEPPLCLPAQLADAAEAARHQARVAGTLRRRAAWPSAEVFAERLAATPGFALMAPDALLVLTRALLRPEGDGFTLRCAPSTEAAIYRAMWDSAPFEALRPFGVPVRFVASDGTPPAPPSSAQLPQTLAAAACGAMFSELAGCSHLMALERPLECAALVRQTALGAA